MYYNSITNEMTSTPPWGSSYVSDKLKQTKYGDWQEVEDSFTPPDPEPTLEEQQEALTAQYEVDKAEYIQQLMDALAHDDNDTIVEIKADIEALDKKYAEDYEALEV